MSDSIQYIDLRDAKDVIDQLTRFTESGDAETCSFSPSFYERGHLMNAASRHITGMENCERTKRKI